MNWLGLGKHSGMWGDGGYVYSSCFPILIFLFPFFFPIITRLYHLFFRF